MKNYTYSKISLGISLELYRVFDLIPGITGKQNSQQNVRFHPLIPSESDTLLRKLGVNSDSCKDFLPESWFWTSFLHLVQRQFSAPVPNFQQNQMGNHFGTHLCVDEVRSHQSCKISVSVPVFQPKMNDCGGRFQFLDVRTDRVRELHSWATQQDQFPIIHTLRMLKGHSSQAVACESECPIRYHGWKHSTTENWMEI